MGNENIFIEMLVLYRRTNNMKEGQPQNSTAKRKQPFTRNIMLKGWKIVEKIKIFFAAHNHTLFFV